jgi:hypothetical protein
MSDAEDAPAASPRNRAERRAAGKGGPDGPAKVNSRSGQFRAEREAAARSAAKSKPQTRR